MRPSLVPFLLFALLAAGCLNGTPPSQSTPSMPTDEEPPRPPDEGLDIGLPWRVDDYWVQRVYYEDDPNDTVTTFDYHVEGTERLNGVPSVRLHGADSQRTYWLRADDGALLKEVDKGHETLYDPPCESFLVDPKAGDNVTHACYRIGTKPPNATRPAEALQTTVAGAESVSVPAGEHETMRMETRRGDAVLVTEYYSTSACFPARVTVQEGSRTLVFDLIARQCGS